ncbi:MAG: DUF6790 family protein [Alphaproteobacteria bacterium]
MQQFFTAIFSNFTITVLVIAAIAAAISVFRRGRGHLPEAALAYYCLIAVGVGFLYNFVMHVFFGEMTAAFIGWADSPFQAEVGWASLGFALVGLLAFRGGFEMRLAAVVGPAAFLLGAAIGHAWQMMSAGNFAPGNAGTVFYTDILTPLLGFVLLWLRYRGGRARRSRV